MGYGIPPPLECDRLTFADEISTRLSLASAVAD
jgi:hypothetical protein